MFYSCLKKFVTLSFLFISFNLFALEDNYIDLPLKDDLAQANIVVFFWYGCSTCENIEPALDEIKKEFPQKTIRYQPIVKRPYWMAHAKAFYVAMQQDNFFQLHDKLYQQIQKQPDELQNQQEATVFFTKNNVSSENVKKWYMNEQMQERLEADKKIQETLKIPGVPAILVNNRYLTHAGLVDDQKELKDTIVHLLNIQS